MIAMTRDHDLTFEDIGKAGGNEFSQRLGDELSLLLFLRVFPTQARYYKEPLKGWEAAVSKFPSAKFDVEEAGRCLALDRYTAAVMHAMRVLEVGLTALAAHYGISTKRENWHEVLVGVEKKVSSLGPKDGKNWQDERQFGSEACVQFRHFKDAWRNHAMHVRQTFDETRARSIYDHVREFMEHLATRLKERRRL